VCVSERLREGERERTRKHVRDTLGAAAFSKDYSNKAEGCTRVRERERQGVRAHARAHSCARARVITWVSKVVRARDLSGVNRARSSCLGRQRYLAIVPACDMMGVHIIARACGILGVQGFSKEHFHIAEMN